MLSKQKDGSVRVVVEAALARLVAVASPIVMTGTGRLAPRPDHFRSRVQATRGRTRTAAEAAAAGRTRTEAATAATTTTAGKVGAAVAHRTVIAAFARRTAITAAAAATVTTAAAAAVAATADAADAAAARYAAERKRQGEWLLARISGRGLIMYILVDKDGNEVKRGAKLTTFRGESCTLENFYPPRHTGSTGRVFVNLNGNTYEFYPSVVNCKIVKLDD